MAWLPFPFRTHETTAWFQGGFCGLFCPRLDLAARTDFAQLGEAQHTLRRTALLEVDSADLGEEAGFYTFESGGRPLRLHTICALGLLMCSVLFLVGFPSVPINFVPFTVHVSGVARTAAVEYLCVTISMPPPDGMSRALNIALGERHCKQSLLR